MTTTTKDRKANAQSMGRAAGGIPRVYLDCRDMWRMLSSKMGIETNERMSSTTNNPETEKEGVVVVGPGLV